MPEPLAIIPRRCQRVYDCLKGRTYQPPYVRRTGWWRIKDVTDTTGHPCDERKLRELRTECPGLVEWRQEKSEKTGTPFKVFRLNPDFSKRPGRRESDSIPLAAPVPAQAGAQSQLFEMNVDPTAR